MLTTTVTLEYYVSETQPDGTISKERRTCPISVTGETEDEFRSAIRVMREEFAGLIPTVTPA